MPNYKDFDRLEILTRVSGVLINETPLRVGVGREPPLGAPVDLAVYRVNEVPCIPGSSLKGVLRSTFEALAASKGKSVHNPWDFKRAESEAKNEDFCVVCGTFGSTEIASHVRVYDAYPIGNAKTFTKYGIGIDREFGSVRSGSLFVEEFVEPNVEWKFRMDIINIKVFPEPDRGDERANLLRELLNMLKQGTQVGARKSVGCGLIRLREGGWKTYSIDGGRLKLIEEGEI